MSVHHQSIALSADTSCFSYPFLLDTPTGPCVISTLSSHYNYTAVQPSQHENHKIAVGAVLDGIVLSEYVYTAWIKYSSRRYEWINVATTYDFVEFQVFVKPGGFNSLGLLMPFDLLTWILTLGGTTVATLLMFVMQSKKTLSIGKFLSIWWSCLMLLLDEVNLPSARILVTETKYRLVFVTLLMMSFQLDELYKGSLCSYLTASLLPETPSDWGDLASVEDHPILTTSIIRQRNFDTGEITDSFIVKDFVISDLLVDFKKAHPFRNILQKLDDKITFITADMFAVVKNITENGAIENMAHEIISVSEKFAIVNMASDLFVFDALINVKGGFIAVKNSAISFFTSRSPWFVRKNFFSVIFSRGLARLVEAGIFQKWETTHWEFILLNRVAFYETNTPMGVHYGRIVNAKIGLNILEVEEKVGLENLKLFCLICLFFVGITCLIFGVEGLLTLKCGRNRVVVMKQRCNITDHLS